MIGKRVTDLPVRSASLYPSPFRERVLPREVRALGELIYVLEGELVLHTNAGEEPLTPGMIVGFRAGDGNGHHRYNRGSKPASYLVVSNRHPEDLPTYSDDDLAFKEGPDGKYVATKKDGGAIVG